MNRKLWLSISASTLMYAAAAHAQSVSAPQGETQSAATPVRVAENEKAASAAVSEVVVTAERRTVNLQRDAIAATVLSGADLANKGIVTVDQLQTASPSLTIQNFGQGNDFNIRGIGKGATNSSTLTGVITYRDGVATFPGYFQDEPFYDIASLEVLRGPQGTFAGQNATGGAVFITENNPSLTGGYHGYLQAQAGNYGDAGLQGAINIPITDTLAARVAFNDEHRDSFYTVTGPYSGHPGELNESSARFSLLWQPIDALRVLFKVDYNYINQGGYPADPFNATNSPFHITSNAEWLAIDQFVRSVFDVNYKLPDGITLRSVTGYQEGRSAQKADLDGTSVGNETLGDGDVERLWSEEVNIISPNKGPLTWIAGFYYSYDQFIFPKDNGFDLGLPPGTEDLIIGGTNPKTTTAGFGQITYKILPGLELQAGARYSDFRTSNHLVTTIPEFDLAVPDDQTEHDSKITGKVALNWTIDADNFVYAFVATGHKGGGLNAADTLTLPPIFKPEDVTDYEIGWKSNFFDRHLKTQVGAYYNDYKNFQVSIGNPIDPTQSLELNITSPTKIYGLEGQAEAVFGPLSFDGGVSLLHSQLGTFYAVDPRLPGGGTCDSSSGPATAVCQDITGKQQVYAPTLTFNVGGQYEFALGEGQSLTPRLNFGHIAPQWATLFEDPALGDRLGQRNLLTAQVAYEHGDWRLTAYGTNLTNQTYISAVNGGLRYAGAPRQYGLRVAKTF